MELITYRIPFTAEHITSGQPNNPTACALALACADHPAFKFASVRPGRLRVYFASYIGANDHLTFGTDQTIKNFINAFDHRQPVQPGTLVLDPTTWIAYIEQPPQTA